MWNHDEGLRPEYTCSLPWVLALPWGLGILSLSVGHPDIAAGLVCQWVQLPQVVPWQGRCPTPHWSSAIHRKTFMQCFQQGLQAPLAYVVCKCCGLLTCLWGSGSWQSLQDQHQLIGQDISQELADHHGKRQWQRRIQPIHTNQSHKTDWCRLSCQA